jgi:mycothiol synthase
MADPPGGYRVRSPRRADSKRVAELVDLVERPYLPQIPYAEADIVEFWNQTTFDLERDAWAITADDGDLVAYAELSDAGGEHSWFEAMAWIHPDHRSRGLGLALVTRYETRARDLAAGATEGSKPELWAFAYAGDEAGLRLLERRGFTPGRQFWHMRIDLAGASIAPRSVDGVSIRRFEPAADVRTMYGLMQEGFSEHWGFKPTPFEDWRGVMDREDYDPDLWFIAEVDGVVAGGAIGNAPEGRAVVRDLVVLKPFRGRGIGAALLERSFEEFRARGHDFVLLNVDSGNESGAVRLYERVGMRVTTRFVGSVKPLN